MTNKQLTEITKMNRQQFNAEKMYSISISIAKSMLKKDIILKEEYSRIDTMLLEKYNPILGTLLAGKPLN